MSRLDEIKARLQKVTPGEWSFEPYTEHTEYIGQIESSEEFTIAFVLAYTLGEDGIFLGNAKGDIEYMFSVIDNLKGEVNKLALKIEQLEAYQTELEEALEVVKDYTDDRRFNL